MGRQVLGRTECAMELERRRSFPGYRRLRIWRTVGPDGKATVELRGVFEARGIGKEEVIPGSTFSEEEFLARFFPDQEVDLSWY